MSFFKHFGKQKSRFTFSVEVHKIILPKGSDITTGDNLSVAFERGDNKAIQSPDHAVVLLPTGEAECDIEETLSLDVTLYKESNGLYQEKIGKINVYQRRRGVAGLKNSKDSYKSIGICSLPLHGLADGKPYKKILPLAWSPIEGCVVHLTVSAQEETGDVNDSDSVASSQVSKGHNLTKSQSVQLQSEGSTESLTSSSLSSQNLKTQQSLNITATAEKLQEQRLNSMMNDNKKPVDTVPSPLPPAGPVKSISAVPSVKPPLSSVAKVDDSSNLSNEADLRRQISELNQALQKSKIDHQNELAAATNNANKTINDLKNEIAKLKKEATQKNFLASPQTNKSVDVNSSVGGYDDLKSERDQLVQQVQALTSQLAERKVAIDDSKAEAIRTKVQIAALTQTYEDYKASSKTVISNLSQYASSLEVLLAEYMLSISEPKTVTIPNGNDFKVLPAQSFSNFPSQSISVPSTQIVSPFAPTVPTPTQQFAPAAQTPLPIATPPRTAQMDNPFSKPAPKFDSSIFDKPITPSKAPANRRKLN